MVPAVFDWPSLFSIRRSSVVDYRWKILLPVRAPGSSPSPARLVRYGWGGIPRRRSGMIRARPLWALMPDARERAQPQLNALERMFHGKTVTPCSFMRNLARARARAEQVAESAAGILTSFMLVYLPAVTGNDR